MRPGASMAVLSLIRSPFPLPFITLHHANHSLPNNTFAAPPKTLFCASRAKTACWPRVTLHATARVGKTWLCNQPVPRNSPGSKNTKKRERSCNRDFQGTAPSAAFASHEVRRLTWTPGERLTQAFWSRCIMASMHTSMACGRALLCPACRPKHIADQSHSPALLRLLRPTIVPQSQPFPTTLLGTSSPWGPRRSTNPPCPPFKP